MNDPSTDRSTPKRRKEKRFQVESERLRCRTTSDEPGNDHVSEGITVDISPSGMRVLTQGDFQSGQPIRTELLTNRSHGIYRGNIRRVEPWVGGQVILGCSLRDTIPKRVLQELASEGIINRRNDGRFSISHPAKVSWPLSADELDVELQDYSSGGMKVRSCIPIPANVRLRFRFQSSGQEVIVESKLAWAHHFDGDWVSGVTFTQRDAPSVMAETLANEPLAGGSSATSSTKLRQLLAMLTL